jgi:hypothetical protein
MNNVITHRKTHRRPRAAANAFTPAIREQVVLPKKFQETLECVKVPEKAMRIMLSAISELSLPGAHYDPRIAEKLSLRYVSHLDFAIWGAVHPDYPKSVGTGAVSRELFALVEALHTQGMSRYDSLLVGDLLQVAHSLAAVAVCRRRPSQLRIK